MSTTEPSAACAISTPSALIAPSLTPMARPGMGRVDTDRVLSYYQSAEAGQGYSPYPLETQDNTRDLPIIPPKFSRRQMSSESASSYASVYSTDDHVSNSTTTIVDKLHRDTSPAPSTSTSATHRHNDHSEGGSDRRRLHIVQMSQTEETATGAAIEQGSLRDSASPSLVSHPSVDDLRLRRGLEGSLALVAPPDASPLTYTYLTPPSTAPIQDPLSDLTAIKSPRPGRLNEESLHVRSASEVVTSSRSSSQRRVHHKPSREAGSFSDTRPPPLPSTSKLRSKASSQLQPPLAHKSNSRSSSPGSMSTSSHSDIQGRHLSATSTSQQSLVYTPGIGEEKQIHERVAAPVVVQLTNDQLQQIASPTSPSESAKLDIPTSNPVPMQLPITPFSPSHPSSYIYYQPGVHATAGPLPPPPRAVFAIDPSSPPPPRPPRLHSPPPSTGARRRADTDAVRQALVLPAEAVLQEKKSKSSLKTDRIDYVQTSRDLNDSVEEFQSTKHTREGAFPPSTLYLPPSRNHSSSQISQHLPSPFSATPPPSSPAPANETFVAHGRHALDITPPTPIESPQDNEGVPLSRPVLGFQRQDSWVPPEITTPSDEAMSVGRPSSDLDSVPETDSQSLSRSVSRSPTKQDKDNLSAEVISPRSSPTKNLRSTLVNLKRFSSLPRTPSRMSVNRLSTGSRSPRDASPASSLSLSLQTSPLPPPQTLQRLAKREKLRTPWPAAMAFGDVLAKKSAAERCAGYAMKINELWMCDCGLGEWVVETKYRDARRANGRVDSHRPSSIQPQPRHVSRSSMASEATFPRRPDAYTATDLSYNPTDDPNPPNAPPPLPYPSLALSPISPRPAISRPTTMAYPPSLSARSMTSSSSGKSSGGFFSSLGRKSSTKREKSASPMSPASSSSSNGKLTRTKPQPQPKPITIQTAPSVPGGPRAPPNRMRRSQTIMVSPLPKTSSPSRNRSSTVIRRASVFGDSAPEQVLNIEQDPEFTRQVDKLADLLPQADRTVLALYLRRAGQDMLAIGQYLEDEKTGTIRYD